MTDFRIRLRSVRMKNGGASVSVLHAATPNDGENWRGKIIEHAKYIATNDTPAELDGFVVIGLWNDGTRSVGYRMTPRIPRELFPSYIAEILRTDAITENEAANVFDDRFYWDEG